MRLWLFFIVACVSLVLTLAEPVTAHTEVFERSPDRGVVYGGEVDRIQISFFASVVTSTITLTDPGGDEVEVAPTILERGDRVAVTEFAALTEPGAYVVTHTELASDGDTQTDSYQFFFDPDSDNELVPLLAEEGPNWPLLGVISGVVLILAGLFWPGRHKKQAPSDDPV